MEKSKVLKYVLEIADRIRSDEGHKVTNGNHFVLALLEVNQQYVDVKLPEGLQDTGSKMELMIAMKALRRYNCVPDEVKTAIYSGIRDEYYVSSIDDFIFSKLDYNAKSRAEREGRKKHTSPSVSRSGARRAYGAYKRSYHNLHPHRGNGSRRRRAPNG